MILRIRKIYTRYSAERLFFLAYGIWMVAVILNTTSMYKFIIPYNLYRIVKFLCLSLALLYEYISTRGKMGLYAASKTIIVLLVFFVFFVYSSSSIWETVIFIYCGRHINFENICRYTVRVLFFTIGIILLSMCLGIIRNYDFKDSLDYSGRSSRWGLGFSYATYFSHYVLLIVLLIVYLYKEKITYIIVLGLFSLNFVVFYFSKSRNSFYLSCITLVFALLIKRLNFSLPNKFIVRNTFGNIFIILALIFIWLGLKYNYRNPYMYLLNRALSGRLGLGARAFRDYSITLFGQETAFTARTWVNGVYGKFEDYTYVDCSYLIILFQNGIVTLAMVLFSFTYILHKSIREYDRFLTLVLIIISLHSALDPQLLLLHFNTFLFMIGHLINSNTSFKDTEMDMIGDSIYSKNKIIE